MAIQSYNPVVRTAGTTEQALERLRNLEIVDRFTGETLVDRTNDVYGTTANFITVSAGTPVATPGTYAIIGKTIFTTGTQTSASADGVHLQFFNCNIIHRPNGTNGTSTQPFGTGQNLNSGDIDARVSEGAATTRSVSFYGCSFNIAPTAPANIFTQWSDAFNSTLTMVGLNIPLPCFNVGSRAINFTILAESVANSVVELYGAPDLQEGLVIRNTSLEITGQGAGGTDDYQLLYTNPNFTGPGNLQRWRTQNSAVAQAAFQVIGPFNPFNNVLADTVRTAAGDNSVQTYAHLRDGFGQILNYYGWSPSFFQDLAQTIPIQGVNARIRTTAALTNTTINGTGGEGSMNTAISNTPSGYGDLSGAAKNTQSIFISNAQGLLEANDNGTYTTDGSTFTAGWIDFLRLRPYNESGETAGGTTIGQTWFDAAAPDNTIFAPISQIAGGVYGQYESDVEYRGYTHNLSVSDTQNGVIGTADGNQTSSTLSPIDESSFVGANIVGVSVKSQNVSAGQPSISFPADSPVSINDVRDAYRAGWWGYDYDIANGQHLTPAINLVLSNVHATDYTATAAGITVRANGIVRDGTNDLFTSDSLGTGDFGGGSVNSHDLTFSGAVTQLGDVVNSTITAPSIALTSFSDSRDSTFNGNITGALSSSFVEGMTFGDGTISFTGLASSISDITTILGTGYSFTNNGGVILSSATATTIDVTPADIEALGITVAEGASTSPVNNITYRYPAEVFVNQVVVPEAGRLRVERVSDKNQVITQSVVTQNQAFDIQYGAGSTLKAADVVRVYYQPSDTSLQPTVYDTTVSALTINATSRPTALYAESSYTTVPGMSTAAGRMIVSFANNIANGPDTQRAFLLAATTSAYFTLLYTQNTGAAANATLEFDFINGGANGSTVIKGDHVRLTSNLQASAVNALVQRTIVNAVDTDTASDFIINFDNVAFATVVIEVQGNLSEAATRLLLQEELVPISAGVVAIEGDVNELEANQVTITANQQVLLTATQRGALKAATYSAGSITQASNVD